MVNMINKELQGLYDANVEVRPTDTLTAPRFVKTVERQKLALELRQRGLTYSDIVSHLIAERPDLLTERYSVGHARQDVMASLTAISKDIGEMANKFFVSELIKLDRQESETRELIDVMQERIEAKIEGGLSIEGSINRWVKLNELRLKIGEKRTEIIKDASPKVSVTEEITLSVDDFNQAKQKMSNIVKINKTYSNQNIPAPIVPTSDIINVSQIIDEEE